VLSALLACREPAADVRKPPGSSGSPTTSTFTTTTTTTTTSVTTPPSTTTTPTTDDCDAVGVETGLSFADLDPGSTASLGAWSSTAAIPLLATTLADSGAALLFSDSPETVTAPGVLYADTVQGDARLYLYHSTGRADPLRYDVLVSGTGVDTDVTVTAAALSGPWDDYLYVGRMGALRYESARAAPPTPWTVAVPAGGTVALDAALDALTTRDGWLMHGIWDLTAPDPVTVSFVAVDPADDPVAALSSLPVAARDGHDRGTFAPTERSRGACADTAGGTLRIRLADGSSDDPWAAGVDAVDGTPEDLAGNYGVHYTIALDLRSTDGRRVSAVLAPRGGPITGAAWVDDAVFDFPSDADLVDVGDAVVLGTWDPAEVAHVDLRWTPAGASSLPVDLLLVPSS
jgi:hypothetical protein